MHLVMSVGGLKPVSVPRRIDNPGMTRAERDWVESRFSGVSSTCNVLVRSEMTFNFAPAQSCHLLQT